MDVDLGSESQAEIKLTALPEHPKFDEVKRYEKIYEFSKEMFSYSENVIKSLEEKSRNNLTAATAIMGFAFLIRKPPEIATLRWFDLLAIILSAVCVGYVYYFHIQAVKPRGVKMPSRKQLQELREETKYPNGVLRSNFENIQDLYGWNLELIKSKGKCVNKQQKVLGGVLFLALIYIVLSKVPTSAPQTGSLNSTWPTTNAPSSNLTPSQIQTPAPSPTTSTSTKEQTSGKATTVPAPATDPVTKSGAGKP
ncbi:hypothetical protein IHN32_01920 [Deinococcus sp. 14RED07]|uniref:hypothetical protein n=1 Tax=Deinococcus sp. 14RED07 TaxID=2745874 RepID=UPI001E611EB8|nr:hypothetical protein [Deinococcus sp. 14RED07]MCD0174711.1 hypothetical protein [Deinococcus sp. 14RED07]